MSRSFSVQLTAFLTLLIVLTLARVLTSGPVNSYRIMFYNVENLFHPADDPHTNDDEYTPDGLRAWDQWKYREKLVRIYKVIAAVGAKNPPAVIGLCEIENAVTLRDLTQNTPLRKYDYRYIHYDSPDRRGIDVALLYRPDLFSPDTSFPVEVSERAGQFFTRDLLYVKGTFSCGDTVHFIVAHWPSRYGGYLATEKLRLKAARKTLSLVDSVVSADPAAYILLMGDFNDGPSDSSLLLMTNNRDYPLHNVMPAGAGSISYAGEWFLFDQFVTSAALLEEQASLTVRDGEGRVFRKGFLLEKDEKWLGDKPYRTYIGYRYRPGFSDHLPIYLDLKRNDGAGVR